jgi:uncharacterized protein (DUF433 family)
MPNDLAVAEGEAGLLRAGIYSLTEAARLTDIPIYSIRRWTLGYYFVRGGQRRWSPPLVKPQIRSMDGVPAVSFIDLQELRFLHAFRDHGVSWYWLRIAHERSKERIGHDHPFSTGKFRSAGREILIGVRALGDASQRAGRDAVLENIISSQLVFQRVISPYLRGLEFDEDIAARWFPSTNRRIVIDPTRNFGQPILEKEGVPTSVLARSFKAERSLKRVARWFDVDVRSVRAAVEFERRLAA